MSYITDCELGLYSQWVPNLESCNASIWSYFGIVIVPVLGVPVAACLIPVFSPRLFVSWLVTGALFALSLIAGFSAWVALQGPSLLDLYGFLWPGALLAALMTGTLQLLKGRIGLTGYARLRG